MLIWGFRVKEPLGGARPLRRVLGWWVGKAVPPQSWVTLGTHSPQNGELTLALPGIPWAVLAAFMLEAREQRHSSVRVCTHVCI